MYAPNEHPEYWGLRLSEHPEGWGVRYLLPTSTLQCIFNMLRPRQKMPFKTLDMRSVPCCEFHTVVYVRSIDNYCHHAVSLSFAEHM